MRKLISVALAALTLWSVAAPGALAIPASVPAPVAPAVPAPAPQPVGLAILSDSTGSYNINSVWPEFDSRYGIEKAAVAQVPAFRNDSYYDATITARALASTSYGMYNATLVTTTGSSIITINKGSHSATLVGGYAVFLDVPTVGGININERVCYIASIPNSGQFTVDCKVPATSNATVAGQGTVWLAQARSSTDPGNNGINGANFAIPAEHAEGMFDLVDPIAKALAVRTTSGRAITQLANASTVVFRCCQNNINSGDDVRVAQTYHRAIVQALLDLGKIVAVTTMPGSDYSRTEALPANPVSVTSGSSVCTLNDPDHHMMGGAGMTQMAANFTVAGATTVGGLTCSGTFTSPTYVDADHISYTGTGGPAGSTTTGGGSSVTRTFNYNSATWPVGDVRWARKWQLNNWILATYSSRRQQRIMLVDFTPVSNTAGDYGGSDKTLKRDGLHFNEKEADLAGQVLAKTLAQLIKNPSTPWFDYTTTGNILPDAWFQATADGTATASVTGSIPHLWSGVSNGSTVTAGVQFFVGTVSSSTSTPGTLEIDANSGANSGAAEYAGVKTTLCRYCTFTPTNALSVTSGSQLMKLATSSMFGIVGANAIISGATSSIGGINPNGTWPITQVDSSGVLWVNTGQTASGTVSSTGGSYALTIDATNLLPTGHYGLIGLQVDIPACPMFRGFRFYWQQQSQGGTTNFTGMVWRPFDPGTRGWNVVNGRTGLWAVGEPVKIGDTTSAGSQRIQVELDVYMEQSSGAACAFKVHTPFLKQMNPAATNMVDPETFWTGPNIVPLSANDDPAWKALAQAVLPSLKAAA